MRSIIVGASLTLAIVLTTSPAHAKRHGLRTHHHSQSHTYARRHFKNVRRHYREQPQIERANESYASTELGSIMARYLGTNPTHMRRSWCGEFMGMAARAAGHQPPVGYALARNWSHAGMAASGPEPGVVMVMRHHVGIVLANLGGGRVLVRSGNHGRRVGDGIYSAQRAIAWRRLG